MKTITFWVDGDPKPQPRPRAFAINGKARVFDPGTAEGWKAAIAQAANEHLPEKPIETPVHLHLSFMFRRPKAHFRANGELKDGVPVYVTKRPDLDNLEKAVMDALTELGMWTDDSLVVRKCSVKYFAKAPGVDVNIQY